MTSPVRHGAVDVREIDAGQTHSLRRAVLRDGTASADVDFPEDHLPGTWHLGAFVDDVIVGTSTWIFRPFDGDRAVQIRGMATATDAQRLGVGSALLAEGVRRAGGAGISVLWANARDTAFGFYERHGFVVVGDGFLTDDTHLPHHRVVRRG